MITECPRLANRRKVAAIRLRAKDYEPPASAIYFPTRELLDKAAEILRQNGIQTRPSKYTGRMEVTK